MRFNSVRGRCCCWSGHGRIRDINLGSGIRRFRQHFAMLYRCLENNWAANHIGRRPLQPLRLLRFVMIDAEGGHGRQGSSPDRVVNQVDFGVGTTPFFILGIVLWLTGTFVIPAANIPASVVISSRWRVCILLLLLLAAVQPLLSHGLIRVVEGGDGLLGLGSSYGLGPIPPPGFNLWFGTLTL